MSPNLYTFRNSGMAVVVVSTCIGSAAAPFVLQLKRIHETLPFGIMGIVAFIAALLALVLPETKGKPTAEALEDRNNGIQHRFLLEISRIILIYYCKCCNLIGYLKNCLKS